MTSFLDRDLVARKLCDLSDGAFDPMWLGAKLANIRRFQGHPMALTVLEHSLLCAQLAPRELKRAALTHDLAEAFVGDVHGPSKSDAQREVEHEVEDELRRRGWTGCGTPVKQWDNLALELELAYMRGGLRPVIELSWMEAVARYVG